MRREIQLGTSAGAQLNLSGDSYFLVYFGDQEDFLSFVRSVQGDAAAETLSSRHALFQRNTATIDQLQADLAQMRQEYGPLQEYENKDCWPDHSGLTAAAAILTAGIGAIAVYAVDSKSAKACYAKQERAKALDHQIEQDDKKVEQLKPNSNYAAT
jgi:hypothetical protein